MPVNDTNFNAAGPKSNSLAGGQAGQPGRTETGKTGQTGKTTQLDAIKISSNSTQSTRSGDRADEVQLSNLSSKINELQSGSVEREAYLEGLRNEVASGTYRADARETSEKLVDDLLRPGDSFRSDT